jgi:hypothetical protein
MLKVYAVVYQLHIDVLFGKKGRRASTGCRCHIRRLGVTRSIGKSTPATGRREGGPSDA